MPSVATDHVSILNMQEDRGVIKAMTRRMRVYFDLTNEVIPSDPSVLTVALNAAGVPLAFSLLDIDQCDALVLISRDVTLVDQDIGFVDVDCKYQHILEGANQLLLGSVPPGFAGSTGKLYGKGKCSITQKPTNFYYPFGIRSVQITGPDPDDDTKTITTTAAVPKIQILTAYANTIKGDAGYGRIRPAGGEINLPFPQANYKLEGVISDLDDPWKIAGALIATINSTTWASKPAGEWLCSEVGWQLLSIGLSTYRFEIEWQHNADGWQPTVVYIDPTTNRPPSDIVQANRMLDSTASLLNKYFPDGTGGSTKFIFDGAQSPFSVTQEGPQPPGGGPGPGQQVFPQIPAGAWTVPALPSMDYNLFFGQFFEGQGAVNQ